MKKLLALILALAMVMSLVACGDNGTTSNGGDSSGATSGDSSSDGATSEDNLTVGGSVDDENTTVQAGTKEESNIVDVVRVGTTENPQNLSPWAGSNSGVVGNLYMFYESLFIMEYKGELEPCLAKSMTQEGNTVTIELFDYIKDSANNPFTASDVVFSLDKAIEGGNISYTNILADYKAEGDYTVVLTLNDNLTVGDLDTFLTNVYYVTEAAYNASADGMVTDPVGTGHYVVSEFTAGYDLVLTVNDDWWQTDEDYVASRSVANAKQIEIYVFGDATTAAMAVETDQVDIAPLSYTDLESAQSAGLQIYTYMMSLTRILLCNCSEDSVLNDVDARKAVYYALENEGLADLLISGIGQPVYDMANSNYPDYYEDYYKELADQGNIYSYDPEKAAEIFAEKGITNLTIITDASSDSLAICEGIVSYLGMVGVTVKISSWETNMLTTAAEDSTAWDLYLRQTASNNYASVAWTRPFLAANYSTGGTCNFIFDDYLQEQLALVNTDEGHTEENVKALYEYIVENAYGYGILCGTSYYAMNDMFSKLSFNASIMLSPSSCIYN